MSKAAVSKSRAEKGKPVTSATPVVTHEIVSGKFNDHDWSVMCERDSTEDFIIDIVDEVVNSTMDQINTIYLERQLLPFTITQAKDAILQIVEWQFLERDDGEPEPNTDPAWLQDEEPDPADTDCWAQGSVPKSILPPPTPDVIHLEDVIEEIVQDDEPPCLDQYEESNEELIPEIPDTVSEPEVIEKSSIKEEKKETVVKKKTKFKPYRGPLKSAGVSRMTESLTDTEMAMYNAEIEDQMKEEVMPSGLLNMPLSCHSLLKAQSGRPPGNKDVVYDELGNVLAVLKLDPERLPSRRVKVKYQIVDPEVEAAQNRLEAMRTGRYLAPSKKTKAVKQTEDKTSPKPQPSKETMTPLPPPLIDAMEVSPGVVVREGGHVRKGPGRFMKRIDVMPDRQGILRPVENRTTKPPMDVIELLDRHTPILRPVLDSPPLPPIVPHPPMQPRVS